MTSKASKKLTRAQKKWLATLRDTGFVELGGWARGQKNRPLSALVELGLAEFGFGPKDSFLKVQGFMPTGSHEQSKPAVSETLNFVGAFLNGK